MLVTNKPIRIDWNPGMGGIVYALTIPQGTRVTELSEGTQRLAVTATREMLPEAERAHCGPGSLFAHDATHRWVFVKRADVVDPLQEAAPEMLAALKRAAPWLGKMIADGAHKNAVLPGDCVRTLQMVESIIAKAEGKPAATLRCSQCAWTGTEQTAAESLEWVYDDEGNEVQKSGVMCPACSAPVDPIHSRTAGASELVEGESPEDPA